MPRNVFRKDRPANQFPENALVGGAQRINFLGLIGFRLELHQRAFHARFGMFVHTQLLEHHDVIVAFHHVAHFVVALRQ